jgi:hypothetical protein
MTDATQSDAGAVEGVGDADTTDLDARISTPDDGFPSFDDQDSEVVQAGLDDEDPEGYSAEAPDEEAEH